MNISEGLNLTANPVFPSLFLVIFIGSYLPNLKSILATSLGLYDITVQ